MAGKKGQKRKRGEKKIMGILAQPIEYDSDFLLAGFSKQAGVKLDDEQFETARQAAQDVADQWHARLMALYEHFGIPPSAPDAQMRLIWAMAGKCFPRALELVRRGEKKGGRTKKLMTKELLRLRDVVQELREESPGLSIPAAAERIKKDDLLPELFHKTMTSARTIERQYHHANRLMKRLRGGQATIFEVLDCAEYCKDCRDELREQLRSGILAEIEKIQPGTVACLLGLKPEELDEILRN